MIGKVAARERGRGLYSKDACIIMQHTVATRERRGRGLMAGVMTGDDTHAEAAAPSVAMLEAD